MAVLCLYASQHIKDTTQKDDTAATRAVNRMLSYYDMDQRVLIGIHQDDAESACNLQAMIQSYGCVPRAKRIIAGVVLNAFS